MSDSTCTCGHGQHVHVGYTGGCGLCDTCTGYRIHAHQWKPGHTRWGSPFEVCTVCGTSPARLAGKDDEQ